MSDVTLLVMALVAWFTVWRWHVKDDNFQLQQVLLDSVTNKIMIEKVGYMIALFVGTWGFVALVQHGKMTEGYFAAYLGVFALSRAASLGLGVYQGVKGSSKAPEQ